MNKRKTKISYSSFNSSNVWLNAEIFYKSEKMSISSGLLAGRGWTSSICSCSFGCIILIKQVEELINLKVKVYTLEGSFSYVFERKENWHKVLEKAFKEKPTKLYQIKHTTDGIERKTKNKDAVTIHTIERH